MESVRTTLRNTFVFAVSDALSAGWPISYETTFDLKLSGDEVLYVYILLVKMMLCSKLRFQKVVQLKVFSCEIVMQAGLPLNLEREIDHEREDVRERARERERASEREREKERKRERGCVEALDSEKLFVLAVSEVFSAGRPIVIVMWF